MRFEFVGGNLALDFTNTVHNWGSDDPEDDLKASADFLEWARQAGLVRGTQPARQGRSQPQFRRASRLRDALYEIFSRIANGEKPAVVALHKLQSFYQNAVRHAEFHPGEDHYRLEWPSETQPFERALREIARSAASLLTSEALASVRQCAGDNCSWLFLDTSRNGLRRWCDMKACGNRAKVRRFRRQNRGR